MAGALTDECATLTPSPWSNPKLTIGEACDLQIKEARKHLEALCLKKAKLEAMDWLNHPYHEVQQLMSINHPY